MNQNSENYKFSTREAKKWSESLARQMEYIICVKMNNSKVVKRVQLFDSKDLDDINHWSLLLMINDY